METPKQVDSPELHGLTTTSFEVSFDGTNDYLFRDLSAKEITMTESLLTPGLQTSMKFHSFMQTPIIKIFDNFKSAVANIKVIRPILNGFNMLDRMEASTRIYRLENRKLI